MIIFDLTCQHAHCFEGWFQSREDFDSQLARGLIACPQCGAPALRRVPSPLHLSGSLPAAAPTAPGSRQRTDARVALRQLNDMLLAGCEDVGDQFAEEARRIHYQEVAKRSIRGEASAEEYEALTDEGIEVFRLPRLKPGDLH